MVHFPGGPDAPGEFRNDHVSPVGTMVVVVMEPAFEELGP